ncbi:hypothetical protein NQ318_016551 [Aromia moschata]|uniref:Uncharacterized protein n=1 Tax=Aromia moschata TaxID=1265417 RepID=A0AAV8YWY0_9CUCU|nr:hypothetical protein NQ318_016551 [Aromia moschata]
MFPDHQATLLDGAYTPSQQRIYLINATELGKSAIVLLLINLTKKYPEVSISNVGVKKLMTKFLETGSVLDIKKSKKWLNEDDADSVLALHSRIFKQNRILPLKPKFRHTLEEGDEAKRLDFCLEMGNRVLNDVGFHKRILFSDESTFSTNGVVSSQHCRYWSETNPPLYYFLSKTIFQKS